MLEQRVNESRPADICAVVSELQLCMTKLQPVVDVCCAVLLKNDTPDVTSLLHSNGLYAYLTLLPLLKAAIVNYLE